MKLFRNIRENMIKDGKLKRYLFYAVGEILLVMIGISLAFQVNNWNDNRIKRNNEMLYYKNIKDQIANDFELILGQVDFNERYREQFQYAYGIIDSNDRSKVDTLGLIMRNMTQYSDFDQQGNIYETLVNSGEIKILRNPEIVNGLRNLEELYLYINRMENIHYDLVMKHIVEALNPILNFSSAEIQNVETSYSFEFQNLLISTLHVMDEKDHVYQRGMEQIELINELIDEELIDP
jgi:hypothetical protein